MSIQHYVAANANPVRPDEATHYRHLVTYADHVAALAEAEQRVRDNQIAYAQALQDMTNSLRGAAQRGSISGLAMMEISRTISELREAKR